MPANIACPKCSAKYKVPSKILGKAVKCQKCGSSFKAAPLSSATKAGTTRRPAQPKPTDPRNKELAKFGLDGPIVAESNEIFDSSPAAPSGALGNLATDPGFSAHSFPKNNEEEVDEVNEFFTNPALPQQKKKNLSTEGRSKQASSATPKLIKQVWFQLLIWLGLLTIACVVTTLVGGKDLLFVLMIGHGICGVASLAVSIWGLMLAYETSRDTTTLILCILVPFYILYFVITHWAEMRSFVWATLVVTILQMIYIPFYFIGAFS